MTFILNIYFYYWSWNKVILDNTKLNLIYKNKNLYSNKVLLSITSDFLKIYLKNIVCLVFIVKYTEEIPRHWINIWPIIALTKYLGQINYCQELVSRIYMLYSN